MTTTTNKQNSLGEREIVRCYYCLRIHSNSNQTEKRDYRKNTNQEWISWDKSIWQTRLLRFEAFKINNRRKIKTELKQQKLHNASNITNKQTNKNRTNKLISAYQRSVSMPHNERTTTCMLHQSSSAHYIHACLWTQADLQHTAVVLNSIQTGIRTHTHSRKLFS